MIYISAEDFFEKADQCRVLSRQEELEVAVQMKQGEPSARERLIESYTPMVAAHIKRSNPHMRTLGLVMYCMQALEKAVDSFDFLQNSEPFSHRLNWYLRQAVASYLVR